MQTDEEWRKALKVGDEVAYGTYDYAPRYKFSKVSKVSPTGSVLTLECGKKFNVNYGDERTSRYSRNRLTQPTDARKHLNEYEAEVNKRRKRNELKNAIALKINRLDLAQIEKLEAFLEQL